MSTPAAYGTTCSHCFKAKCKCIYRPNGTCERCHRLNKTCSPSSTVRSRKTKKPPRLEDKLDDLVTLLQSQVSGLSSQSSEAEQHRYGAKFTQLADKITPVEAEKYLNKFRQSMLVTFPFVEIKMSAAELFQERPFLWFTIMSITAKSQAARIAMGEEIQVLVSQKLVCGYERTLDMLLGMICFLLWSHHHKREKPYIAVWSQLMVALAADLGLGAAPRRDCGLSWQKPVGWDKRAATERTDEEKRAGLSAFLLGSCLSTKVKRDTMRWTPYLEECLQEMSGKDELLSVLVRTQLVVQQLSQSFGYCTDLGGGEGVPTYYVDALVAQIQEIRRSLPARMAENVFVQLFLHNTALHVYEAAATAPPGLSGLTALEKCLQTVKLWQDTFLQIPPSAYEGLTMPIFFQGSQSIFLLLRISTLDYPGWDATSVRNTVDIVSVVETLANNLDEAGRLAGIINDGTFEDAFRRSSWAMRQMRDNWAAELSTQPELEVMNIDDQWLADLLVPWYS